MKTSFKYSPLPLVIIIGLLVPSLMNSEAFAKFDPDFEWYTLETEHFLIHYQEGLAGASLDFAQRGQKIHQKITTYFNWTPREKTHIILSDQQDSPNGNARVRPSNTIEIFMSPPTEISSLEDYLDWKSLVFEHEYVHIVHLDMAKDFPLHLRRIFGRHFVLFPNTFLPTWIIEGIATYIETDKKRGTGRGQSSYFRALMRNEVKKGIRHLSQVNQAQLDWPGGTNRYLYGVYFFNFLEKKYGKKSIQDFIHAYSRLPIPYFLNTAFKNIYGQTLNEIWSEFEVFLHEEFDDEIKAIQNQDKTSQQLSQSGFNSGFAKQLPNGDLLFIRNDHKNIRSLIRYEPKKNIYKIIFTSVKIGNSFDIHPSQGILIPMADWVNSSRLVTDLYHLNIETAKSTRLTFGKRYVRAVWHRQKDQIIAIKNEAGQHQLHLLDRSGKFLKVLWKNENNVVIGAMDFSPVDESLVASVFRPGIGWNLEEFSLANQQWKTLTNNHYIESHPVYRKNGKEIIYSAEYNGIYNIYQLSLINKELRQLTNITGAAHYPLLHESDNTLYYSGLSDNGFNLQKQKITVPYPIVNYPINEPLSEISQPIQTAPLTQTTDKLSFNKVSNYNGIKYLSPSWWEPLPIVLADKNQRNIGFLTSNSDPIRRHLYFLAIAYDLKNHSASWNINYSYTRFLAEISLNNSNTNFYPNPVERRQEQISSLTINVPFLKRNNNWNLFSALSVTSSSYYLTSKPDKKFRTEHDNLLSFGVNRRSAVKPSLAVNQHSGSKFSLSYELNSLSRSTKSHSRIRLNTAYFSPLIYQTVFELGTTIIASGNLSSRLYLGGNTNSFFQNGSIGKKSYQLKGFNDASLVGSNLQSFYINWFVPISYPQRSLMVPPIGISTIKLNPFFQAARIGEFDNINHQPWLYGTGTELSFQSNFGYGVFPFTFTIGLAKGLNATGELNVYLKYISRFF